MLRIDVDISIESYLDGTCGLISRVGMEAHDHQNMQFFKPAILDPLMCPECRTYCSQLENLAHNGFLG